jgi:hypothetical protein
MVAIEQTRGQGNAESIDEQVQRDIEVRTAVRRFKIKVCRCRRYGKVQRGKHPLQTSTTTGCRASPGAMAVMNKTLGLFVGQDRGPVPHALTPAR